MSNDSILTTITTLTMTKVLSLSTPLPLVGVCSNIYGIGYGCGYGKTAAVAVLTSIPLAALLSEFKKGPIVKHQPDFRKMTTALVRALHTQIDRPLASSKRYIREVVRTLALVGAKFGRVFGWTESPYRRYASREEEDAYWREAEVGTRMLASSSAFAVLSAPTRKSTTQTQENWQDDTYPGESSSSGTTVSTRRDEEVRLITYYSPKLLPTYRENSRKSRRTRARTMTKRSHFRDRNCDMDPEPEVKIAPKTFVKWHWLTFPEKVSLSHYIPYESL